MSTGKFHVRKAAVLGAGVMGAQIAAHLSNAGIPTVLFELAAKEGDPKKAISMLDRALAEQADHADAASLLASLKS